MDVDDAKKKKSGRDFLGKSRWCPARDAGLGLLLLRRKMDGKCLGHEEE